MLTHQLDRLAQKNRCVARLHPQRPAPRPGAGDRLFPGLPLLYRRRRASTTPTAATSRAAVRRATARNPTAEPVAVPLHPRHAPAELPGVGRRGGPGRAAALRRQVPAGHGAGDGQGRRGHGLLRLQPPGVAQRGRRRPGRFGVRPEAVHALQPATARPNGPMPCRRCPPTTPSAARTCGPGSTSCRRCPQEWRDVRGALEPAQRAAPHDQVDDDQRPRRQRGVPALPDARRRLAARAVRPRGVRRVRRSESRTTWSRPCTRPRSTRAGSTPTPTTTRPSASSSPASWTRSQAALPRRLPGLPAPGQPFRPVQLAGADAAEAHLAGRARTRTRGPSSGTSAWWIPTTAGRWTTNAGEELLRALQVGPPRPGRTGGTWPGNWSHARRTAGSSSTSRTGAPLPPRSPRALLDRRLPPGRDHGGQGGPRLRVFPRLGDRQAIVAVPRSLRAWSRDRRAFPSAQKSGRTPGYCCPMSSPNYSGIISSRVKPSPALTRKGNPHCPWPRCSRISRSPCCCRRGEAPPEERAAHPSDRSAPVSNRVSPRAIPSDQAKTAVSGAVTSAKMGYPIWHSRLPCSGSVPLQRLVVMP